ncbi:protein kinase [Cryptococcus neoformans]|nr:protein kinase [Cryptococcus neoformans var. grubii Bt1]OXH22136.1 protein kinase [Cryptococcus neoformans var. grubii]
MPSPEDSRFDTEIPQVIAGKYNVKVERQMAETNEESEPLEDLCKDLPEEFLKYLQYCRTLKFDSDPDYQYLRLLFHQLFLEKGYENDWEFDWCKKANNEGAAEEKDDKELLEAHDKKNGNNAEKQNDISKDLEGSNNVTNADTD